MYKPLEIFIGLRYTRAKRRNSFISIISLISILGIALGVMTLITVISVMNGFEKELRARILGMTAHATVQGPNSQLKDWRDVALAAKRHPEVVGSAPFVQGEGMLSFDAQVNASMIRGVLPETEPEVADVHEHMTAGDFNNLKPGAFGIVLGSELARQLGVLMGDKVTLIIPQASVTPAGLMPRLRRFEVVGIFEVGMHEYDSALALIHLQDASKLYRMNGAVTGLRLKLNDMFRSIQVVRELVKTLNGEYWVSDWTKQHANFFRAVQMEKTTMFVILMMIVGVAAFNLVSTLVMLVVDKQPDIAIMRTLGATPGMIMKIFVVQGTFIGTIGTTLGILAGVTLALNVETLVPAIEQAFGVEFLAADVYYISELPSDLQWSDVFRIGGISFLLCMVMTLYPAWRASRVQPVEALRYE